MRSLLGVVLLTAACAGPAGNVSIDPDEAGSGGDGKADGVAQTLPDVQCAGTPDAGPKKSLRHFSSKVLVAAGGANHRGSDLLVSASETDQVIRGDISYTLFDKALEDEDVDVFACRKHAWQKLGSARTDDEGHFKLTLSDDDRLPIGMRDMYVSVAGDRSGARFLAIVADDTNEIAVSDVDGTLTTSENAFASNLIGIDPPVHAGAAEAWKHIAATGRIPVFITARAATFTQDTREWLAKKGFPRGALRLSPSLILPGSATVEYKSKTMTDLATELPISLGVGNRATDIDAYSNAGLAPDAIFIKLPEFSDELAPRLQAGEATGFDSYPGPLANL